MTVILLFVTVVLTFFLCVAQRLRNSRPVLQQNAFKFVRSAAIFLGVNIVGFLLTIFALPVIRQMSLNTIDFINGIALLGWPLLNLILVYKFAPAIERRIGTVRS